MKAGWEVKPLGEIAEVQSGGTPRKSTPDFWGGDIAWYSSGELNSRFTKPSLNLITELGLAKSNAKIFPIGSLLIGMYDTAALKMSILDRHGAFNQAIAGVKPNNNFSIEYVHLAIEFMKPELLAQRRGVRQKNLSLGKIKTIPIPLPPLEEQKRIVAVLDGAFDALTRARAHVEANLLNARELFESMSDEAFTKIDGQETSIGDVVDVLSGYAFKSKGYIDDPLGIRLVRGDNIVQGKFRWKGVKRWPAREFEEYARFQLAVGDVLLAMDRTWVKDGIKYSVVANDDTPSLLVQRVARLRNRPEITSGFLSYLIGSRLFERYVLDIQTGLGVPHISGQQIKDFSIYLPSIDDQSEIVKKLDGSKQSAVALQAHYQQKLTDLDDLRQSLLQKAFAGELT